MKVPSCRLLRPVLACRKGLAAAAPRYVSARLSLWLYMHCAGDPI